LSCVKTNLTKRYYIMARIIDGKKKNLIGTNLQKYRYLRGLSQRELSEQLELYAVYVCRGSISRIEDYSRTVTDVELYTFAKVLKVSIEELLEGNTSEQ